MSNDVMPNEPIRGQTLIGDTVVISEKVGDCEGIINSTLTGGILKLAQAKGWPLLLQSTFIESEVIAVKMQKNCPLLSARFIRCHFKGTFFGVDFGHLENQAPPFERDEFGRVEHCDFTQARLEGCRFFNTDISTLKFAGWPQVVIPDPHLRAQDVDKVQWPGKLRMFIEICTDGLTKPSACVDYVPSMVKRLNCTPEEIRTAFEQFGGVLM